MLGAMSENNVKHLCVADKKTKCFAGCRYSPIGIIFLIASKFVETDDIADIAARLGMYMVTVLSGLAIHAVIVLPLIYFVATRKNPAVFAYNMLKAILTAWGTASRSAPVFFWVFSVLLFPLKKKNTFYYPLREIWAALPG